MNAFEGKLGSLLSRKPRKRELAAEIDLLNAALSNAGNIQDKTEKLWRMAEEQATTLGRALTRANQKLEKYDESALAEARRLAVLQHSDSNTGKSYEELVQWLSTGQWPDPDVKEEGEWLGDRDITPDMLPAGSDGPEPEVGTTTAYAHGYIKGWNTLLDKLIATISPDKAVVNVVALEQMRKTFNRSEAM